MSNITIIDGGMGRELLRIGAPFRQPEWSAIALWEGPEWVVRAHRNFIEAGAEVITTNSYALVPFHIGQERFGAEGQAMAGLAGRLAREAADVLPAGAASSAVRVAGSLPPLFGSYQPELFNPELAPSIIDPLVRGLSPYVDIWLGETLGSIVEARAVAAALERAGGLGNGRPLWISFTLSDSEQGQLKSGEPVAEAVVAALDCGADAVLFNCSHAETIGGALATARDVFSARRSPAAFGGYANRFLDGHSGSNAANDGLSGLRDDLDPEYYCTLVEGWATLGATIVGGCCGMTPDHIAALAARFRG